MTPTKEPGNPYYDEVLVRARTGPNENADAALAMDRMELVEWLADNDAEFIQAEDDMAGAAERGDGAEELRLCDVCDMIIERYIEQGDTR
jgi:hypothetical protein